MAFFMPISRVRSLTDTNITVIMLRLATKREIAPTADKTSVTMSKIEVSPSFCLARLLETNASAVPLF